MSLLMMLSLLPAFADRHVEMTGSDLANDCFDAAVPCATLEHAVFAASAGETVHVGAGTWSSTASTYPIMVPDGVSIAGDSAATTRIAESSDGLLWYDYHLLPSGIRDMTLVSDYPVVVFGEHPDFQAIDVDVETQWTGMAFAAETGLVNATIDGGTWTGGSSSAYQAFATSSGTIDLTLSNMHIEGGGLLTGLGVYEQLSLTLDNLTLTDSWIGSTSMSSGEIIMRDITVDTPFPTEFAIQMDGTREGSLTLDNVSFVSGSQSMDLAVPSVSLVGLQSADAFLYVDSRDLLMQDVELTSTSTQLPTVSIVPSGTEPSAATIHGGDFDHPFRAVRVDPFTDLTLRVAETTMHGMQINMDNGNHLDAVIRDSVFDYGVSADQSMGSSMDVRVRECSFSGIDSLSFGSDASGDATISVHDTILENSKFGLEIGANPVAPGPGVTTVDIERLLVRDVTDSGVVLEPGGPLVASIDASDFSMIAGGVRLRGEDDVSLHITNTVMNDNGYPALWLWGGEGSVTGLNNTIMGNGWGFPGTSFAVDVKVDADPLLDVDLGEVWMSTTDAALAGDLIYDGIDDPALSVVDFTLRSPTLSFAVHTGLQGQGGGPIRLSVAPGMPPFVAESGITPILVEVGGVALTNVSVSQDGTQLQGILPPMAPGVWDVVVTNPGGQTGTVTGGVTVVQTPPVQLELETGPMVLGASSWATVSGATPNARIILAIAGNVAGAALCPPQLAPDCSALPAAPAIVLNGRADANGTASFVLPVPAVAPPSDGVVLQAVTLGTVTSSPAVAVPWLDGAADTDADGLDNAGELAAGTDALDGDSDGDRCLDGVDLVPTVAGVDADGDGWNDDCPR